MNMLTNFIQRLHKPSIKYGLSKAIQDPNAEILDLKLTARIQSHFGAKSFISSRDLIDEILLLCYDHHCNVFLELVRNEKSFQFYSWCIDRLENILEDSRNSGSEVNYIDRNLLATYKRALRLTIEEACSLNLLRVEESYDEPRFYELFGEIFKNVHKALYYSNIRNMAKTVSAMLYLTLETKGNYYLTRDPIFDLKYKASMEDLDFHSKFRLADDSLTKPFVEFITTELGCTFENWLMGLSEISKHLIATDLEPMDWDFMIKLFTKGSKVHHDKAYSFFDGMLLKPHTEQVQRRAYRTNVLERQLYKPILNWTLENHHYVVYRRNTFIEALSMLVFDTIPWDDTKVPTSWRNHLHAHKYFISEKDKVGKILENKVEQILGVTELKFIRDFKYGKNQTEGEIDFVFLDEEVNVIYLCECKNLIKRPDNFGWLADKNNFVKNSEQMERHIGGTKNHFRELCREFSEKYGVVPKALSHQTFVPIFILNSPTLFMYESEMLVVSWKHFEQMVKQKSFTLSRTYFERGVAIQIRYPFLLNTPSSTVFGLVSET